MESLNRLLIFATYTVVGCLIGIAAWVAGAYYGPPLSGADAAGPEASANVSEATASGRTTPGVHVDYLFAQRAQIERLQKLLAEKTELLDRKNRLLEEKTLEQRRLELELDEAIGVLELMAVPLGEGEPQGGGNGRLQEELERLREERNKNAALAEGLANDLEELRAQLAATDADIQTLQQQSELETTVLWAEMQTFQGVASEALAGLGVEAVPALVDLLKDPRPRIRCWAAEVLGEIGPPASEAVPALVDAISDQEPQVQLAVREALDQIQPAER
jgi:hypothetical protein